MLINMLHTFIPRNAQRPGAVAGMKKSELEEAMEGRRPGECIVVRVAEHKTGFTEAAKIVFDAVTEKMLKKWCGVLDSCDVDSQYAFPTLDGAKNTHMFRVISRIGEDLGHSLPTSREVRVSVELRAKTLPDAEKERVSRSMSHSESTAAKYYRANLKEDCHLAFQSVQDILKTKMNASACTAATSLTSNTMTTAAVRTSPDPGTAAAADLAHKSPVPESTSSRRKKYNKTEEDKIRVFFSKEIEEMHTPTMQRAEAFLKTHSLPGRTKKDIYDKVRNMFRYTKN